MKAASYYAEGLPIMLMGVCDWIVKLGEEILSEGWSSTEDEDETAATKNSGPSETPSTSTSTFQTNRNTAESEQSLLETKSDLFKDVVAEGGRRKGASSSDGEGEDDKNDHTPDIPAHADAVNSNDLVILGRQQQQQQHQTLEQEEAPHVQHLSQDLMNGGGDTLLKTNMVRDAQELLMNDRKPNTKRSSYFRYLDPFPDTGEEENDNSSHPLVLWATHTGTSRKFAMELAEHLGDRAEAMNINEMTLEALSRRRNYGNPAGCRVYFVCSTFGGRSPRDGRKFFAELQGCSADDNGLILKGVNIAVAALGDTSFEHFAVFGMMLSYELRRLGATEMIPVTTMDRRRGRVEQERVFAQWQQQLLTKIIPA
jgi:flavodoxin